MIFEDSITIEHPGPRMPYELRDTHPERKPGVYLANVS